MIFSNWEGKFCKYNKDFSLAGALCPLTDALYFFAGAFHPPVEGTCQLTQATCPLAQRM